MIPKGLFAQIITIIVSITIFTIYVRPEFGEIGSVQDSIIIYQEKREGVAAVNKELALLVSRLDSVSNTDQRKLLTYLPDVIDHILVNRDLLLISREAGVSYQTSTYLNDKKGKVQDGNINLPTPHMFTLSVVGTYSQLKNVLYLTEQNHYPLEVNSIDIQRLEGELLSTQITFVTYTYKPQINNDQLTF
jgi:hypothetical protein